MAENSDVVERGDVVEEHETARKEALATAIRGRWGMKKGEAKAFLLSTSGGRVVRGMSRSPPALGTVAAVRRSSTSPRQAEPHRMLSSLLLTSWAGQPTPFTLLLFHSTLSLHSFTPLRFPPLFRSTRSIHSSFTPLFFHPTPLSLHPSSTPLLFHSTALSLQ